MNYHELCFGYGLADDDVLTTYERAGFPVGGREFTFRIVGSSHFVTAPAIGFEEIASCEAETVVDGRLLTLDEYQSTSLRYESDAVACRTAIDVVPIGAFPTDEPFDLEHEFEPRAVTAIDVSDRHYETWHTYPEHDCAVYTVTEFDRID